MMHIEIHVIQTDRDVDAAVQCGLLDGPFEVEPCHNCDAEVGSLGDFEPFAIVLDETDDPWIVCYDCALPIIEPVLDLESDEDEPDDDGFLLY
jgi:hypothetical protein